MTVGRFPVGQGRLDLRVAAAMAVALDASQSRRRATP
jgi:hypothetical protein